MPTFRDRGLLIDDRLVVADLHLGKGDASSVELPIGDCTDVVDRLRSLAETHDPEEIVVAGDLLHSFSTLPRTVRDAVSDLSRIGREAGARVVVVPGNHDTMLESAWSGPVESEYRIGDTVVCHGHEEPAADAERYVIGHDHPTIEIEGRRRHCYLVAEGSYRGATVIQLPAFNRALRGVVVNEMHAREFQSPLVTDADALRPVVWDPDDEETLSFPPLGEFRRLL